MKFNQIVKKDRFCKESLSEKTALLNLQQRSRPKRDPRGNWWSQLLLWQGKSKYIKSEKYSLVVCISTSKWKINLFVRPITIFTTCGITLWLSWKSVQIKINGFNERTIYIIVVTFTIEVFKILNNWIQKEHTN